MYYKQAYSDYATKIAGLYGKIYEQNNDLVGWIRIDGTVVDYPVMQTSVDNRDYYLRRDFDGSDATRGCIYVREECDVFTPMWTPA